MLSPVISQLSMDRFLKFQRLFVMSWAAENDKLGFPYWWCPWARRQKNTRALDRWYHISEARDQKQFYRLNETKSHSRGEGIWNMFCCLIRHYLAFLPPNWPKIGQIFVGVLSILTRWTLIIKLSWMLNPDLNYKKIKYFQQLLLYTFCFVRTLPCWENKVSSWDEKEAVYLL